MALQTIHDMDQLLQASLKTPLEDREGIARLSQSFFSAQARMSASLSRRLAWAGLVCAARHDVLCVFGRVTCALWSVVRASVVVDRGPFFIARRARGSMCVWAYQRALVWRRRKEE